MLKKIFLVLFSISLFIPTAIAGTIVKHPVGYFAYESTRTPQDREAELKSNGNGVLIRVPGNGTTFFSVCESVGRTCDHVRDWTGKKFPCSEDADDGSRAAFCEARFTSGCYAYESTSTPKDRESELSGQAECGGSITRLTVFGYSNWGNFNRVCKEVNLECKAVKSWDGKKHACSASSHDGSRVAVCE